MLHSNFNKNPHQKLRKTFFHTWLEIYLYKLVKFENSKFKEDEKGTTFIDKQI